MRVIVLLAALGVMAVLGASPALALAPPTPWNGVNPFNCTIQDAGQGTTVPDPGADPYCVRFDKTNQNVTQLGLITFLTEEPARFASAVPKCFYYQEDHWRGSLIQSDQQTVVYEFYGHYFFNKATGDGGAWVTDFTIAGHTFDPRTLPGFPPQYDQDFGPGTGGFITHDDIPADPSCVAQANQSPGAIYAQPPSGCVRASGLVTTRRIGPVRLDSRARRIRSRLGPPQSSSGGLMRYCLAAGGTLLVAGGAAGSTGRAAVLIATSRAFKLSGGGGRTVRVGAPLGRLRAAFPEASKLLRAGGATVFRVAPDRDDDPGSRSSGVIVVGVTGGRVAYLAIYDTRAIRSRRALTGYLRQAS